MGDLEYPHTVIIAIHKLNLVLRFVGKVAKISFESSFTAVILLPGSSYTVIPDQFMWTDSICVAIEIS